MLNKKIKLPLLLIGVLFVGISSSSKSQEIFFPDVPEIQACERIGPTNRGFQEEYQYIDDKGNKIGLLIIKPHSLEHTKLELYDLQGRLHGLTRTWLRGRETIVWEEVNYVHGLRHGFAKVRFHREWESEDGVRTFNGGELIGLGQFTRGTGVMRKYSIFGKLLEEIPYRDNLVHGVRVRISNSGEFEEWWMFERGFVRRGINFNEDGSVGSVYWQNEQGQGHGPFLERGKLLFFIDGVEVSSATYREAAAKDQELPPFVMTALECKRIFMDEEVTSSLEHYKKLDPVEIPLPAPE